MTDAGLRSEFIPSGGISLINSTDSLTYIQLQNVLWDINTKLTSRQRTDSVLEKLADLSDFAIEGDIATTSPDIATWITLSVEVNNVLPSKTWDIVMTPESGVTKTIRGTFYLTQFKTIDSGQGTTTHHIRLESTDGVITIL